MQDISSKVVLRHNDVFSDVINALIFREHYIDGEKLKDVVPESAYDDFDGNLRSMERDLLKEYGEGDDANYFAIAEFGIDNQTTVDPTIPVRVMGYDYTVYKKQLDEYNNRKRELYHVLRTAEEIGSREVIEKVQDEIRRLGDFSIIPVVTIILNFSHARWNKAKSLKALAPEGHPKIAAHMQDYKVEVFDVLYLDEETRGRFTSDFRDIVTVLTEGAINKGHDFQRLKYPVEVLDMLYAYTKDEHYLNIRNQIVRKEMEGEGISMGDFFDQVERNKIIETARRIYQGTKDSGSAVQVIEYGLNVSTEEAKDIFEAEIMKMALA